MPYVAAKYNSELNEYRCGVNSCNSLLFKGEVIAGKVEKKCKCGVINIVDNPVRQYGSYQERVVEVKKHH